MNEFHIYLPALALVLGYYLGRWRQYRLDN